MNVKQRSIRLRYAGLVNFAGNITSVLFALFFMTMVSRKLPEEQFGLWHYLIILTQYFIMPANLTNYWLIRYTGRGYKIAKTGIILNTLLMTISLIIFILLTPITIFSQINLSNATLIVIALIIRMITDYYQLTLMATASGAKPQAIGYGQIIFEATRLPIAYLLIMKMNLGLLGVIIVMAIAKAIYTIFLTLLLKDEFTEKFNKQLAIKWIKLYWLPILGLISAQLLNFDVILMTFTYSSLPVAHMKAIQTIIAVMLYTTQLYQPLYPILLSGGSSKDIEIALSYFLLFAIPMMAGISAMSKTFLSLLKAPYAASANALTIATIYAFTLALSRLFAGVLLGVEKVEIKNTVSMKEYVKSKLFYVPAMNIIIYTIYLIVLYLTSKLIMINANEPASIVLTWITIKTIFITILMIQFYRKCREEIEFKIPLNKAFKYTLSSTIMLITLLYLGVGQKVTTSFMEALKLSIIGTAIGATIYLTILLVIEPEVKELIKMAISEAKTMLMSIL